MVTSCRRSPGDGKAVQVSRRKCSWDRISALMCGGHGVSDIADAAVIQRSRVTRSDLNQLIGLPGYNQDAIMEVLKWYGQSGYVEAAVSTTETPRAIAESAKTRA